MSGCNYKSRLDAVHDGQLDAEQSREMTEHLSGCEECSRELENLRGLSRALSQVRFEPISQIELARIHRNLALREDRSLFRLGLGLSAVAASILIISMAWLTQGPSKPSTTRTPIVSVGHLPAWEQMAMGTDPDRFPAGGIEAPGQVKPDNTGVAENMDLETANWMLEGVSR